MDGERVQDSWDIKGITILSKEGLLKKRSLELQEWLAS